MSKANPNEFAKAVLWHLAGLEADVYHNQLLLVELLARQSGKDAGDIQQLWKKDADEMRQRLYSQALSRANIPIDTDEDETDFSRE